MKLDDDRVGGNYKCVCVYRWTCVGHVSQKGPFFSLPPALMFWWFWKPGNLTFLKSLWSRSRANMRFGRTEEKTAEKEQDEGKTRSKFSVPSGLPRGTPSVHLFVESRNESIAPSESFLFTSNDVWASLTLCLDFGWFLICTKNQSVALLTHYIVLV